MPLLFVFAQGVVAHGLSFKSKPIDASIPSQSPANAANGILCSSPACQDLSSNRGYTNMLTSVYSTTSPENCLNESSGSISKP